MNAEFELQRQIHLDVLRFPILGNLLRSRFGRFIPQVIFALVALLIIYDGFTGSSMAAANSATVISWVLFRGFIILTLLLVGNIFCMACPFTLTRTLAHQLSSKGIRWPQGLRNKWLSIGTLFLLFWLYEWLDLWASPAMTAWIVVAYFLASFVLEVVFRESAFCKYVCPLGAFNFVQSSFAPLQIQARSAAVCARCEGKECVNGSESTLGCGTELYVPTIESNMDCTLCLDCSRACPYDNVGLIARKPFRELIKDSIRARWDYSFLFISLSLYAILNAFGMVSPIYTVLDWMEVTLGISDEGLRLFLIFGLGVVGLTALIAYGCGRIGEVISKVSAREIASRYASAFVPMGAGIWLAHYGFHFSIGALSILPVMQSFLLNHGVAIFGTEPNWDVGFIVPMETLFPVQVLIVLLGFFGCIYLLGVKGLKLEDTPGKALGVILPWALTAFLMTAASLSIFNLPMEMRGMMSGSM